MTTTGHNSCKSTGVSSSSVLAACNCGTMLKVLTLTMIFVLVLCDNKADEKVSAKGEEAHNTTTTNTTTGKPASPSYSDAESVSEGLKAVTYGAKQIISGVLEVGTGIINAITRWFDGGQ